VTGRFARWHVPGEWSDAVFPARRRPSCGWPSSRSPLDGKSWWPYVPPFAAVLAPAERRLGTVRWLVVGTAAHLTGTYLGQGYLRRSIRARQAPPRLADAHDVGVSYFLLGVAGTLSAYLPRRHRTRVRAAAVGGLAANATLRPTFTEVGHLSAFVTGLALSPLATDRDSTRTSTTG